jgi:hypothetical protein
MGRARPQREMGYGFDAADLVEADQVEFQKPASLEKIQVTAQDEGAVLSVANGVDRQSVRIHRFSIGSRGLYDTR